MDQEARGASGFEHRTVAGVLRQKRALSLAARPQADSGPVGVRKERDFHLRSIAPREKHKSVPSVGPWSRLAKMYILLYITFMGTRYSITEARSHLPAIVDQAASGLDVELTRRGEPVAVVVSTREIERLRGRQKHFSDAYRHFVAMYSTKNSGVGAGFAKSVRDRKPGRRVLV